VRTLVNNKKNFDNIKMHGMYVKITVVQVNSNSLTILYKILKGPDTRWFKYDRDWLVCKQAALRNSRATLSEWSHNLHPPSCSV
jgi:hypothetical protein